jgi:hypothetical protein
MAHLLLEVEEAMLVERSVDDGQWRRFEKTRAVLFSF